MATSPRFFSSETRLVSAPLEKLGLAPAKPMGPLPFSPRQLVTMSGLASVVCFALFGIVKLLGGPWPWEH